MSSVTRGAELGAAITAVLTANDSAHGVQTAIAPPAPGSGLLGWRPVGGRRR